MGHQRQGVLVAVRKHLHVLLPLEDLVPVAKDDLKYNKRYGKNGICSKLQTKRNRPVFGCEKASFTFFPHAFDSRSTVTFDEFGYP